MVVGLKRIVVFGLLVALGWAALYAAPVRAEGSRTYHPAGAPGDRAWLEFITGGALSTIAGIARQTTIHVFAWEGETIYLGSSAVGIGAARIEITSPLGAVTNCGAAGFIANRAQELAGPQPLNPAGYAPCVVVVPPGQSGIWDVRFISPNPPGGGGNNPPLTPANVNWVQNDITRHSTAAWDVTVVSVGGVEMLGRAYADYLAMNMGGNGTLADPAQLDSVFYFLTNDGYLYSIDLNGMNPFGFMFFGNNKGFQDTAGVRLYRSVQLVNDTQLLPGEAVHNPDLPDTATDVTHKIFFNIPAPDLPVQANSSEGLEWLRLPTPVVPPPPSNFRFIGSGGQPGITGVGQGGTFLFDLPLGYSGGYSISIDLNNDGDFADPVDRVLRGDAAPGTTNTLVWDGLDGLGQPVGPQPISYEAEVRLNSGEVHFPFLDVEANPNGLIIGRQATVNGGGSVDYTVYYNDSGLPVLPGEVASNPMNALLGIDSNNHPIRGVPGAHEFGTTVNLGIGYGNIKGINTWVYVPGPPVRLSGGIAVAALDLGIEKRDVFDPVRYGGDVIYQLRVYNNGPSPAIGALVIDDFPDYLRNVRWGCTPSPGARCSASGTGNIRDVVDIPVGGELIYGITAQVDFQAPNPFPNIARVDAPPGIPDINLSNNQDDEVTSLPDESPTQVPSGRPRSSATILKTAQSALALPGQVVIFTITITNPTGAPLTNVEMTDAVPAALAVLSATASSGSVTIDGQRVQFAQPTLNPGETATVTLETRVNAQPDALTIVNTACLNDGLCSSVGLETITRLPRTGETPWWRLVMLAAVLAAGCSLCGMVVLRRLSAR